MDKILSESFMFCDSSAQLRKELGERFGQTTAPRLFELHQSLTPTFQNKLSVVKYYCKLKTIWDQLQMLEGFPECTCGVLKDCSCGILKKMLENEQRNKLMQFLSGLTKEYDQVRTNILSSDPLPTVHKAYYILQQVEHQNKIGEKTGIQPKMSAFNVVKNSFKPGSQNFKRENKRQKSELYCENCKKKGHSIEQCFKIIGYPEWWPKEGFTKTKLTQKNVNVAEASSDQGVLGAHPQSGNSSNAAVNIASSKREQFDPVLVSALYTQVMKMVNESNASSQIQDNPLASAFNYAGP